MNRQDQLAIYKAQTSNFKILEKAWKQTKRTIHRDLLSNNQPSVELQTKLLALIYCSWSETALSKLIHTPHGFELDEIRQIKVAAKSNIVKGWEKCIALALRKVQARSGNHIPNVKQELERLVKIYVEQPHHLRNKIAHGQWLIALNEKHTAINNDLTSLLAQIDLVKLDLLRDGCIGLCQIIEALIESPNKAFHKDYWTLLCDVKHHLDNVSKYSLSDKVTMLKEKRGFTKNITITNTDESVA